MQGERAGLMVFRRLPDSIEAESLAIIRNEIGRNEIGMHGVSPEEFEIVVRMVQASADLEFARATEFRLEAVRAGIEALRHGRSLVVDVQMLVSGLRRDLLTRLGVAVRCAIQDETVRQRAVEAGTTRAAFAIEQVTMASPDALIVIGNAPTALIRVVELIHERQIRPPLVIGMPVGFVLAAESKELLREVKVPAIFCRGRKGGSAVAAAATNQLLKLAVQAGAGAPKPNPVRD